MLNTFDICDFGAVADGKTDCTAAVQAAIDAAARVGGKVIVPPGEFLCGYIKMGRRVTLEGTYAWDFRSFGGSVLKLNDKKAKCLIDMTGAFGATVKGMSIDGGLEINDTSAAACCDCAVPKNELTHGIMLNIKDRSRRNELGGAEDTVTIADCRIGNFSGDAVHYDGVWCFSIRHSMLCYSRNGLFINGCDGFIEDNWFSVNRNCGIYGKSFMAGTFTSNRIECNSGHGAEFFQTGCVHFTGNYFDYNKKCGFYSAEEGEDYRANITFTGNLFHVSGISAENSDFKASHIEIRHAVNILITGNNFVGARHGESAGPLYGITVEKLKASVITNNTMQNSALVKAINDLGGHKADTFIEKNTGVNSQMPNAPFKDWPRFDD